MLLKILHSKFYRLLMIALMIFGARLWFIQYYGNSVPHWDQWDGEAANVFIPWLTNHLEFSQLFTPHNEHRIFFTRLLGLLLLIANDREWNPLLEMVFNAGISTLTAIVLILILHRVFTQTAIRTLIMVSVTVLWCLPYAWENILSGFQSCWYLMNLLTLLAFWGMLLHRQLTWQWWVGLFSGVLAYFNLATGFFALAVIAALKFYLFIRLPADRRSHFFTFVLSSVLVILGVWLTVNITRDSNLLTHHADLQQFWQAFGVALSWPWLMSMPWLSVFTYLPFLLFIGQFLRPNRSPTPAELLVLALGFWVILQAAAMAYARGNTGLPGPAFRYLDILALGALVNLLAWYLLATPYFGQPRSETKIMRGGLLLTCFWVWLWLIGPFSLTVTIWPTIEQKRLQSAEQFNNTRHFLLTGEMNTLIGREIPYPSPARLAGLLNHPKLRSILPHTLVIPKLLESSQADSPFVLNGFYPITGKYRGEDTLGSYGKLGNPAVGRFISTTLKKQKGFLEIPVAGYLGETGLALQLLVEGEESQPITIQPPYLPRETWVSCYVRMPDRPFQIVAIDHRPDLWFAFAMPRGIGKLSFLVNNLLQWGKVLFFLSGWLLIGGIFCGWPGLIRWLGDQDSNLG